MQITYHNIKGGQAPFGYVHATVAEGSKIVFISGQVGTDREGKLANGLANQIKNALINIGLACDAAGADAGNIAKVTFYVVNWNVSMMQELVEGTSAAKEFYDFKDVAMTLLSVNGLFTPEMLVEIEAIAII